MTGCVKKPVLATDRNTSNFLMHLKRHQLEWCAELIEAQEKSKQNTSIYGDILYSTVQPSTVYLPALVKKLASESPTVPVCMLLTPAKSIQW